MRYNRKWLKMLCLIAALIGAAFPACASGEVSAIPEADLSEFFGRRIGVMAGTTQEAWTPEMFRNPEMFYFNSVSDSILALNSDKIDAFFGDNLAMRYAAGMAEGVTVLDAGGDDVQISSVFQKTERGDLLRGQFNEFIEEYRDTGKLDKLANKWIDGPESARWMNNDELPDVNGTVTIATQLNNAPFEYLKDGVTVGFEIELLRDFCKAYGYCPVFSNTSFDALVMGVYTGKFDIGATELTITEERKQSVNFGEPYLTSHSALLVRTDGGWTGTEGLTESGTKAGGKKSILQSIREGLRRTYVEEERWKLFTSGMLVTLEITVLSVLFGSALGFALYLICRNGNRPANIIVGALRWFITGMPLVVFLMVLFYIVFVKSGISGTSVSVVGFTIVFGFTVFDLIKAGENAVDIGQKEAAYALGYSDLDAFLRIILPQAAMHFMPGYMGEVVSLIKAAAVVGYITVLDVTKIGDIVRGRTYDAIYPLLAVVIAYFVLASICRSMIRLFIRKIDTKRRPKDEIMKEVQIR